MAAPSTWSPEIRKLLGTLSRNPGLVAIDFMNFRISSPTLKMFADTPISLMRLNNRHFKYRDAMVYVFSQRPPGLCLINASHSTFDACELAVMCGIPVEYIDLSFSKGEWPGPDLVIPLQYNNTLLALNLSHIDSVGDLDEVSIGIALRHQTTLTALNLSHSKLSQQGKDIMSALCYNRTLTSLDLGSSNVKIHGDLLGSVLRQNTTLTLLNLHAASVTKDAAESIDFGIRSNTTLTSLDLGELDPCDIVSVLSNLRYNGTLISLGLKLSAQAEVATMLQHNTTLTSIDLGQSRMGDAEWVCTLNPPQYSSNLKTLGLGQCLIPVEQIATIIRYNSTLTSLDVRGCQSGGVVAHVTQAMYHNITLESIDFDNLYSRAGAEWGHILAYTARNRQYRYTRKGTLYRLLLPLAFKDDEDEETLSRPLVKWTDSKRQRCK